MNWLQASQWRLKFKRSEVEDQLLLVATECQYDPIADFLRGLKWDKRPRLDEYFFTHVRARRKSDDGRELDAHLRRVGSKFFISGVARALDPGCQVDTMVVLEGTREGEGKTEMCRRLFRPWYGVTRGISDKDALMFAATTWGVELGELSAIKKSEDEHWKSFLDSREDKFRMPYGRRMGTFKRRCVFVGTTNNPRWLNVGKGKRRYWPVFVEHVDLDAVERDREQLWAEAVVRFDARERFHLTAEERAEADAEAEARVEESFIEAKVEAWWHGMQPDRRPKQVTLLQVIEEVLRLTPAEASRARGLSSEIGAAMTRVGFDKGRVSLGGKRQYCWVPTPEMCAKPAAPGGLRLVPSPEEAIQLAASARLSTL